MEMDLGEVRMWGYMKVEMDLARKNPARAKSIAATRAAAARAGSERAVASRRRARTTEPQSSVPHRSTGHGRRLATRRCARLSAKLGGFLKKGHHRDEKKTAVVRALRRHQQRLPKRAKQARCHLHKQKERCSIKHTATMVPH